MVEVMQEKGVDMGFCTTQLLRTAIAGQRPEIIITMGCGEQCPFVPGAERRDWDLADPAGQSIEVMRQTRDDIETMVKRFIDTLP